MLVRMFVNPYSGQLTTTAYRVGAAVAAILVFILVIRSNQSPPPLWSLASTVGRSNRYELSEPDYTYCQAPMPRAESYIAVSNADLMAVHLITRHGDRSPVNPLARDTIAYDWCAQPEYLTADKHFRAVAKTAFTANVHPLSAATHSSSCLGGELTDVGVEQLFTLGTQLRAIYADRLQLGNTDAADPNKEIYVRSTDYWRTQRSAAALLNALYPQSATADVLGAEAYKARSISVFTVDRSVETMYHNPTACPAVGALERRMMDSPLWQSYLQQHDDVFATLQQTLLQGESALSGEWRETLDHAFDHINVRRCHSAPLPCSDDGRVCIDDAMAKRIVEAATWEYHYRFGEFEAPLRARIGLGGFFAEISKSLSDTAKPTADARKFIYFSAHDSTLAAILGALNITHWRWPPYASSMIIETWKSNTQNDKTAINVRVIYNGQILRLPFCPPNADGLCSLSTLLEYLSQYVPLDYIAECAAPKPRKLQTNRKRI